MYEKYLYSIVHIRFKKRIFNYELEAYLFKIENNKLYLIYLDSEKCLYEFEVVSFNKVMNISVIRVTNNLNTPGYFNIESYYYSWEEEKRLGYKMSSIDREVMEQIYVQLKTSIGLDIPESKLIKI